MRSERGLPPWRDPPSVIHRPASGALPIGKLVVVGVGLIGGSCALALKRAQVVTTIVGIGRGHANLDEALRLGAIDRGVAIDENWAEQVRDADLVLLATPVAQYGAILKTLRGALGHATIVTDTGSTKQDVIGAARAALGAAFARFVPGHPIAGASASGVGAATSSLFDKRTVIVTPLPETDATCQARVAAMWQACGAHVVTLDPVEHDRIFAAVSHLPHLLAFAYVAELASRPQAAALFDCAGSGFRDFTRIAGGSPEMWRDIALANRPALQDELAAYRATLALLSDALEAGDGATLERVFTRARAARRQWEATHAHADTGDE